MRPCAASPRHLQTRPWKGRATPRVPRCGTDAGAGAVSEKRARGYLPGLVHSAGQQHRCGWTVVDFRILERTFQLLDDARSTTLLSRAIAAIRGDCGGHGPAVQSQCEPSPETGPGGADGAFFRFARSHGLVSSEERLSLLSPLEGGNEHEIFRDPEAPGFVLKVTEPALRLRNGRDRIPKVTLRHYLERWHLANAAFGDQAELVLMIETSQGIRMGIRQPFVVAADPFNPNPPQQLINRWLRAAGFDYHSGAWMRKEDKLVMLDTHEGNFILSAAGIRPVDVELYRMEDASGPVVTWETTRRRLIDAGLAHVF